MIISWANVDDFKLSKLGKFIRNGIYYFLVEKCSVCGDPYFASSKQFKKGKARYCGVVCRALSRDTRILEPCFWCGRDIKRRPAELKEQSFCSHFCHVQFKRSAGGCLPILRARGKKIEGRLDFCLCCGKIVKKSGTSFCSRQCSSNYQYLIFINKWKLNLEDGLRNNGFTTNKMIRRYLWEKYSGACSRCGWKEINLLLQKPVLEIEHINGDCTCNKEQNLDLICPNCHTLTPTYKALNKGNGNRARLKYYKLV